VLPFSPGCAEEDEIMKQVVDEYGCNFDLIADILYSADFVVGSARTPKMCQERYISKLQDQLDSQGSSKMEDKEMEDTVSTPLSDIQAQRSELLCGLIDRKMVKQRETPNLPQVGKIGV
jgi:hypothetical protein